MIRPSLVYGVLDRIESIRKNQDQLANRPIHKSVCFSFRSAEAGLAVLTSVSYGERGRLLDFEGASPSLLLSRMTLPTTSATKKPAASHPIKSNNACSMIFPRDSVGKRSAIRSAETTTEIVISETRASLVWDDNLLA